MASLPVFSTLTFSAPNGEPLTLDALNYALICDHGEEAYTVRVNTEGEGALQHCARESGLTPGVHLAVCLVIAAIEATRHKDGTPLTFPETMDLLHATINGIAIGVLRESL